MTSSTTRQLFFQSEQASGESFIINPTGNGQSSMNEFAQACSTNTLPCERIERTWWTTGFKCFTSNAWADFGPIAGFVLAVKLYPNAVEESRRICFAPVGHLVVDILPCLLLLSIRNVRSLVVVQKLKVDHVGDLTTRFFLQRVPTRTQESVLFASSQLPADEAASRGVWCREQITSGH